MKVVRIPFSRAFLMSGQGIEVSLFKEMLNFLPKDSRIVGFGESSMSLECYIFIESSEFINTPDGMIPPDAQAMFRRYPNGTVQCDGLDLTRALDSKKICYHQYVKYTGLSDSYNYCKICGAREPS